MNINDLIGKRCLLKLNTGSVYSSTVTEYKVLEASPSRNWIKLMDMNGRKFWKPVTDISFVEELIDLRADRPQ